MCRLPVTFGGGSTIEYGGLAAGRVGLEVAGVHPALGTAALSTAPGSQDLGRASPDGGSGLALAVTAPFYEPR